MSRAFVLVMDSLGLGGAADAEAFGDSGADTLGHIAAMRTLDIPNLLRLGLGAAAQKSSGKALAHVPAGASSFATTTTPVQRMVATPAASVH